LQFIDFMEQTGLDLKQFSILINNDAIESMKLTNNKYNFVKKSMGNINGKHDGDKFAKALLQVYYGLEDKDNYDKIIFDFDDTIWTKLDTEQLNKLSAENLKLINDKIKDKAVVISGNTYKNIRSKLIYGSDFDRLNVDIWADANTTLYRKDKVIDFLEELVIDNKAKKYVDEIGSKYGLSIEEIGKKPVNYKIKSLTKLERKLLVDTINSKYKDFFTAKATGNTTVDILNNNNDKTAVFDHCKYQNLKTLFIGDEINGGNDSLISKRCSNAVEVKNIKETNVIIKTLVGE